MELTPVPCPVCKSTEIANYKGRYGHFRCICTKCRHNGGPLLCGSAEEAVSEWNKSAEILLSMFAQCPFCKGLNIEIHESINHQFFWGTCRKCGCQGPSDKTQEGARKRWNFRPATIEEYLENIHKEE